MPSGLDDIPPVQGASAPGQLTLHPGHPHYNPDPHAHPGLHVIAIFEAAKCLLALLAASGLELLGPAPLLRWLHEQGIDRLAPPLKAEAVADDGTIEAVSLPGSKGFLLGVQWHPEWRWSGNPVSRALFGAFGDAVTAGASL